jgi:hypothetical protein
MGTLAASFRPTTPLQEPAMNAHRVTRRKVLQVASAAVAAPLVIPRSVLGDETQAAASERVTIGHIGVGGRGRALMHDFRGCKEAQSVAVADAYLDRREAMAKAVGGKGYADFRELLARDDIDAVVVATPDHWHVPIANAAARAQKDAYVEKPLGLTIEQNLSCRKVFEENKRIFQYGTQQRSQRNCYLGCELVRQGKIGKVRAIEVVAPNGGSGGSTDEAQVPAGFDYDTWLGPAPKKTFTNNRCNPPGTYWIYDYSIGYLGGWGAHPLDIMVWGSDADLQGPITIEGTGDVPTTGLYDTVFNWDVVIQTPEVKITFKPGGDSTRFIGSEGWVQVRRGGTEADPQTLLEAKLDEAKLIESRHHASNFVAAVKSRKPAVSNLADAVRSDNISQLCDIAIRLKRKITWDPQKEIIVGDDEASRMMHRDMREPWTL